MIIKKYWEIKFIDEKTIFKKSKKILQIAQTKSKKKYNAKNI